MDVVADDGHRALSLIALVGSVFSPFYAAARDRAGGRSSPFDHCSMNVALYGDKKSHWAFTERGRRSLERSPDRLAIGPSAMRWESGALVIDLDEVTAIGGERVSGTVRLTLEDSPAEPVTLDAKGRHTWWPIAPIARAEVALTHPNERFSGDAYFDANRGDEPLEDAFFGWSWSRVASGGRARVVYDAHRRDGSRILVAREFEGGEAFDVPAGSRVDLGRTRWLMPRTTHAAQRGRVELVRTLEDTPFYARSLVRSTIAGRPAIGTHEALSLDRFRSRAVQFMLPYRMKRASP